MYQASEAFSGSILGHSRAFLTQIEIGEKAIAAEISAILYTAAANPGDYVTIGGAVCRCTDHNEKAGSGYGKYRILVKDRP
ncbi:MAG: hypothetical protein V8S76_04190 [Lachnospiraceae bacterium]